MTAPSSFSAMRRGTRPGANGFFVGNTRIARICAFQVTGRLEHVMIAPVGFYDLHRLNKPATFASAILLTLKPALQKVAR
jgi:hypothetical protein